MSKLKSVFNKGPSMDEEIDNAFSTNASAKPTFSERVLESQKKFGDQFQNPARKPADMLSPSAAKPHEFGRFDPDFAPDTHLDPTFDETKNLEDFRNVDAPGVRRDLQPEPKEDLRELATATPRRGAAAIAGGDTGRMIEELEDIKAQNSEILRRIQRIEEKLRKVA